MSVDLADPARPLYGLGDCAVCQGPLCVDAGKVRCDRCGAVQEGHPLALASEAARAAQKPDSSVIPGEQMAMTGNDRLTALEKRVAVLEAMQARTPTRKGA